MRINAITPIFFLLALLFGATPAPAQAPTLLLFPEQIIQGEPLMVQIDGVNSSVTIKKITFDNSLIGVFEYQGKPTGLVGIDLNKKPGTYELAVEFSDGQILNKVVLVGERQKIEAPLGIPQKLGGNTEEAQNKLVTTLADENKELAAIFTSAEVLWTEKFVPPLEQNIVTDEYGYSRKTGAYSIAHKGVDYRAPEGTPVMAANRGVVRIAKTYRNYGQTVVVDHGLGLMSFYMHLSKTSVSEGGVVERGQVIGLSGQTGYAGEPHLHLTLRINGSSIDPVKFLELFR